MNLVGSIEIGWDFEYPVFDGLEFVELRTEVDF